MTLIHYASGDTRDTSGHQGLGLVLHETELFGASCGRINGAFFAHRGDTGDRYVEFRVQALRPANNCFSYIICNHWVNQDIRQHYDEVVLRIFVDSDWGVRESIKEHGNGRE